MGRADRRPFWSRNSPALCFLTGGRPLAFSAASLCFCFTLNSLIIVSSPVPPTPALHHHHPQTRSIKTSPLLSYNRKRQSGLANQKHTLCNKTWHPTRDAKSITIYSPFRPQSPPPSQILHHGKKENWWEQKHTPPCTLDPPPCSTYTTARTPLPESYAKSRGEERDWRIEGIAGCGEVAKKETWDKRDRREGGGEREREREREKGSREQEKRPEAQTCTLGLCVAMAGRQKREREREGGSERERALAGSLRQCAIVGKSAVHPWRRRRIILLYFYLFFIWFAFAGSLGKWICKMILILGPTKDRIEMATNKEDPPWKFRRRLLHLTHAVCTKASFWQNGSPDWWLGNAFNIRRWDSRRCV